MVEVNGKVLYLKILDSTRKYVQFEYFLRNDSTYFRYEYNPNGSYRAFGEILVRDEIVKVDSVWLEDPNNPGTFILSINVLTQILRTGTWTEYSGICRLFSNAWIGDYKADVRVGNWKHWVRARSGLTYLVETIDYSAKPIKTIYTDNVCMTLPSDSVKQLLIHGWRNITEDTCSLYEFMECDRNKEGVFYGYCEYWLYDLHGNGTADINDHESESGVKGTWSLEGTADNYVVRIKPKKGSEAVYDLVYLDRKGYMLLRKK
jgi:hypothetical protein